MVGACSPDHEEGEEEGMSANGRPGNWTAAIWLVAIVFAVMGQFYMTGAQQGGAAVEMIFDTIPRDGLVFFVAGAALFILLVTLYDRQAAGQGGVDFGWATRFRDWLSERSVQVGLVVAAAATGYTTVRYLQTKAGGSYWDAAGLWLLGAGLYLAAFVKAPSTPVREWPAALRVRLSAARGWLVAHRLEMAALAVIVLVAIVTRFYMLGQWPSIVSGDEGRIGSLGRMTTFTHEIANPFITTYGHSTLYLFVEGSMLYLFGPYNALGLRILHAIAGVLGVIAVYLLAREMFDARVGLLAAALMTVSHFYIHFTRIIVAAGVMDVLMTTVSMFLFWRALRTGKTLWFVLAGFSTALAIYMYMGGRLAFLFVLAYIVALYVVRGQLARPNTGNFLALLGAFAILILPMALWMTVAPQEFNARFNQVGIYAPGGWMEQELARTGKSQIALLIQQFRDSMLVFNYYPATFFYNARLPMLDQWTAVPFVIGLFYALWKAFEPRFLLLHAWFWSAIIGGQVILLSPGQAVYRVMVILPVVMIWTAVVLVRLIDIGAQSVVRDRRVLYAVLGVFLAVVSYVNLSYYFGEYQAKCLYEDPNTRVASYMGQYLGSLRDDNYSAYLFTRWGLQYGIHPTWDFFTDRKVPITNIDTPMSGPPAFVDTLRGAVFLIPPERAAEGALLKQYYPGGKEITFTDCGNVVATAWVVPADQLQGK
jgi:4-amino-4-deoxy-L-arabinose transferase-like glycosyltransferase